MRGTVSCEAPSHARRRFTQPTIKPSPSSARPGYPGAEAIRLSDTRRFRQGARRPTPDDEPDQGALSLDDLMNVETDEGRLVYETPDIMSAEEKADRIARNRTLEKAMTTRGDRFTQAPKTRSSMDDWFK